MSPSERDVNKEWVLPASIPFADLKARDLEECVYWLLDAMGAKDLEWRTGGSGGGAADGGRDLEAHFYAPSMDDELQRQKWWIECKGRAGTVEPEEVKSAANNALGIEGLDYLVIATNTQFSNPTRDWVKQWQQKHPRPLIRLWDHSQLERFLSRHPEVVLRLFSEALSLGGRFKAMESRFWNKLEFVTRQNLIDLWNARDSVEISAMGIVAAIANEFANGDIAARPWAAYLSAESVLDVFGSAFQNAGYLAIRSSTAGIDQKIIFRTFAYLVLSLLDFMPADIVSNLMLKATCRGEDAAWPDEVLDLLLMPVMHQLLSEIQDVCGSDCSRISILDRGALPNDEDEVKNYWLRLEYREVEKTSEGRRILRIEKFDEPCLVGFEVSKERCCPLFGAEPTIKNVEEILEIIKRVAAFRKAEAKEKRTAE